MSKLNQHVVPHAGRWAVKSEGRGKPTSVHETKGEAIDAARTIVKREGGEVIVHGPSGLPFRAPSGASLDKYQEWDVRAASRPGGAPEVDPSEGPVDVDPSEDPVDDPMLEEVWEDEES